MKTTKTLIKLKEKDFTKDYGTVCAALEDVLNLDWQDNFLGNDVVLVNGDYYKIKNADHFNGHFYSITLKKLTEKEKEHI